jgi:ADP-ribose pyrophosphatase
MTSKKDFKKSTAKAAAVAKAEEAVVTSLPDKSQAPKAKKPAKAPAKMAKVDKAKPVAKKIKPAVKKAAKLAPSPAKSETAKILDSQIAYEGPLFRVLRDHLIEPDGRESHRDVIRHNGSVVILAVDPGKKKKDPWVVIERQYRHAAGQYLWELPAGKLDAGEKPIDGAKRELSEETGYAAKNWSPLVEYYASPGFLGEAMKVFLAEGLLAGDAHPEEDEHIDFRLVKLSELLAMVDKGKIIDGKTLTSILLYARKLGVKREK